MAEVVAPPKPADSLKAVSASQERRNRRKRQGDKSRYNMFDSALIKSKVEKIDVEVVLALDTPYTNEDGVFIGKVLMVDQYAVQFQVGHRSPWISKAFIVSVDPAGDDK